MALVFVLKDGGCLTAFLGELMGRLAIFLRAGDGRPIGSRWSLIGGPIVGR